MHLYHLIIKYKIITSIMITVIKQVDSGLFYDVMFDNVIGLARSEIPFMYGCYVVLRPK